MATTTVVDMGTLMALIVIGGMWLAALVLVGGDLGRRDLTARYRFEHVTLPASGAAGMGVRDGGRRGVRSIPR